MSKLTPKAVETPQLIECPTCKPTDTLELDLSSECPNCRGRLVVLVNSQAA